MGDVQPRGPGEGVYSFGSVSCSLGKVAKAKSLDQGIILYHRTFSGIWLFYLPLQSWTHWLESCLLLCIVLKMFSFESQTSVSGIASRKSWFKLA